MIKTIFRDFDHFWQEGHHGWTSASRNIAKAQWDLFEPTILASRDEYKNAYVALMNEKAEDNSDYITALLDYIDLFKKEDAPKFFKWWSSRVFKEDNE